MIHNSETSGNTEASLRCQFDEAMERQYCVIVVEPPGLGSECIRWIKLGNFLHKTSVLTTMGFLVTVPIVPTKYAIATTVPLGLFGVCCAAAYSLSWQSDPCCKYQVDYRGQVLTRIPSQDIHCPNPIVLVRRNDKYRKILQNTFSVVVVGYVGLMIYRHFYS